jgi:hypothetical protein
MHESCRGFVDKESIFEAYVCGDVKIASELESIRFNTDYPDIYLALRSELSQYSLEAIHEEFREMMAGLIQSVKHPVKINSRIKSPSSVYHSLTRANSDELTITEIRDLIGFRLLVESENFDQFYDSSVDVLVQLVRVLVGKGYLSDVRVHNSTDHPLQQVHLQCKVRGIFVEIKLMNQYYYPVFERTLYPLWEGFVKDKFPIHGLKNIFYDTNLMWGITCAAFNDAKKDLKTLQYLCQCEGLRCEVRDNMTKKRYRSFSDRIDLICKELDISVSEKVT